MLTSTINPNTGDLAKATQFFTNQVLTDPMDLESLLSLQRDVLEIIALDHDIPKVLNRLCRLIETMIPDTIASVMRLVWEEYRLHLIAAPSMSDELRAKFDGLTPGKGAGSCGTAVYLGEPVIVCDTLTDPRWVELRPLVKAFGIVTCWSVPIRSRGNKVLGSFAVSSTRHCHPSPFHLRLLETASFLAGIAIKRALEEERLGQIATAFENTIEGVMITDLQYHIIDINPAFCDITGYSAEDALGRTLDFLHSGRHDEAFYQTLQTSLKTLGKWQGEIWNRRKNGEIYPAWLSISVVRDQQNNPVSYVGVFADISAIEESEKKLLHLAHHDPLTDLPNRLLFQARLEHVLERCRRANTIAGVLFLDLDRFKNLNDALGHALGDKLLVQVAQRLRSCVRENDNVARLGDDAFTIILEALKSPEDAGTVAKKVLGALNRPFTIEGSDYYLSASIGISLYPEDGEDLQALLKNADAAMYQAKQAGRNTYYHYTPELTTSLNEWIEIETNLRRALEHNQFTLYFQPQIGSNDGRIIGAEVLLRWHHPELGSVPPSRFIPIAEDIGLIGDIGEWVLRNACEQTIRWERAGLPLFRLAVNVAGLQISHDYIHQRLHPILRDTGLNPARLQLEISESFVMKHPDHVIEVLNELNQFGIQLAIDDFGTGYSSLSYLKRLQVHELKIDQSLVRDIPGDPNSIVIAKAVIALGHSLGLCVIAEGVETEQQKEVLRRQGCDAFQGYCFARPMPAEQFAHLLAKGAVYASTPR